MSLITRGYVSTQIITYGYYGRTVSGNEEPLGFTIHSRQADIGISSRCASIDIGARQAHIDITSRSAEIGITSKTGEENTCFS